MPILVIGLLTSPLALLNTYNNNITIIYNPELF